MNGVRTAALVLLWTFSAAAAAQQLDARFSCSNALEEDGRKVIYADHGQATFNGDQIGVLHWESALHRSTHGFDCSIDEEDGLTLETWHEGNKVHWRVGLVDPAAARARRGYDFTRGMACTIRFERDGDALHIRPTCPALCGSRSNFSELTVNMKTGACRYQE